MTVHPLTISIETDPSGNCNSSPQTAKGTESRPDVRGCSGESRHLSYRLSPRGCCGGSPSGSTTVRPSENESGLVSNLGGEGRCCRWYRLIRRIPSVDYKAQDSMDAPDAQGRIYTPVASTEESKGRWFKSSFV